MKPGGESEQVLRSVPGILLKHCPASEHAGHDVAPAWLPTQTMHASIPAGE
jgi:hypothetical protein